MRWTIHHKPQETDPESRLQEIITAILTQRGLEDEASQNTFFSPPDPLKIKPETAGLDPKALKKIVKRLQAAIKDKQPIIIFGDYDADGITATAILWEALHKLGAKAHPFIPHREKHGYGLSIKGLKDALNNLKPQTSNLKPLVITVDNGIVAHQAANWLKDQGLELIITDHHQIGSSLPPHDLLLHSTEISGAGMAWFLAKALSKQATKQLLDLVTIGTVADIMTLQGVNRAIAKAGLKALQNTKRPGLKALYQEANLDQSQEFSTYHIGFVIGPRLNAMGRMESGMDSLRLLCTTDSTRARKLAQKLALTNQRRQDITQESFEIAHKLLEDPKDKLLIIDHPEFHEGIIGLVAGKLTEKHYRPSIVISRGKETSKASARSISGVNIIELIRSQEDLLLNAGGHPLAAGFSIETSKLNELTSRLLAHARETISDKLLTPELNLDVKLQTQDISWELFKQLEQLKPFGLGNKRPLFALHDVNLHNARRVGRENHHLKISLQTENGKFLNAIGFNLGFKLQSIEDKPNVNLAFSLDKNTWNNQTNLQLKLKDIQPA